MIVITMPTVVGKSAGTFTLLTLVILLIVLYSFMYWCLHGLRSFFLFPAQNQFYVVDKSTVTGTVEDIRNKLSVCLPKKNTPSASIGLH